MEWIKESLQRYVNDKIETGRFLRAVLENDLFGAVGRADFENINRIEDICKYIYNELPSNCWGSKEIVEKWLKKEKVKIYLTTDDNRQDSVFYYSGQVVAENETHEVVVTGQLELHTIEGKLKGDQVVDYLRKQGFEDSDLGAIQDEWVMNNWFEYRSKTDYAEESVVVDTIEEGVKLLEE